ncbi:MAG: hypothetical protein M1833_003246 [Piccolia ochrophora]|nr:MAG: hypothetical protein M1833_003246 [Piccolia ochrophora]
MSNDKTSPPSPPSPSFRRRASFSPGQALSGFFNTSRSPSNPSPAFPNPITTAAANAQNKRRLSISTLGLSGTSPTQTSPFAAGNHRESVSSSTSGSGVFDENAIDEEGDGGGPTNTPATPFARRMSFGARALRDVRMGNGNNATGNGRASSTTTTSSPSASKSASSSTKIRGEGFNWADSLRSRAERTSSVSGTGTSPPNPGSHPHHQRSQTVASLPAPAEEVAKPAPRVPDAMQERILKGDFYMD